MKRKCWKMRAALTKSWAKAGIRDSYLLRYHVHVEYRVGREGTSFRLPTQATESQRWSAECEDEGNKVFAELQTVAEMEEVSKRCSPTGTNLLPWYCCPLFQHPSPHFSSRSLSVLDSGKRSPYLRQLRVNSRDAVRLFHRPGTRSP